MGDVAQAVHVLIDHYEALGDRVLKMLAEEDRIPGLRELADGGRAVHCGSLRRLSRACDMSTATGAWLSSSRCATSTPGSC